VHGRPRAERFHVRGFMEEGTTTTPFDMVVKNGASRFHFCLEALRRAPHVQAGSFIAWCNEMLTKHAVYIRENGEDLPEIRDWVWTD
jgi:xylulose-5-phosphate/fructose-6-phosphate phosphoketolase